VSGVIDSLGALARASSDDGKAPDFASIPFLGRTDSNPKTDFEGACTLLFSFLKLVPVEEAAGLIERICASITEIGKSAIVKIRVLTNLYNILDVPTLKLSVLMVIIRAAANAKQLELLGPFLAGVGSWQTQWGVSDAEARKLYLLVSQVLGDVGECTLRGWVTLPQLPPDITSFLSSLVSLQRSVPGISHSIPDNVRERLRC